MIVFLYTLECDYPDDRVRRVWLIPYSLDSPSPLPSMFSCWATAGNNQMLSNGYICILVSEIGACIQLATKWSSCSRKGDVVILSITLYTCVTKYKASNSPLIALFYRDGLGYFFILLCRFLIALED